MLYIILGVIYFIKFEWFKKTTHVPPQTLEVLFVYDKYPKI